MKLSGIFQALAVASYSTLGSATILFERLPSKLNIGDEVQLNWTADHDYTLSMSLQKTNPVGVTSGSLNTIFYDLPMSSGNMSYNWVVPNVTVVRGDRFSLELTGTGPMDSAGTTNTTNLFELPVNVSEVPVPTVSAYCDDSLPWKAIVGITVGCVAAFFLGATAAVLGMRLWQKKKTDGAGFEQVDKRPSVDGSLSLKSGGRENTRAMEC